MVCRLPPRVAAVIWSRPLIVQLRATPESHHSRYQHSRCAKQSTQYGQVAILSSNQDGG